MAAHHIQLSLAVAEEAFAFLTKLEFALKGRFVSEGQSFKDGWRLTFAGPRTRVIVQYMDMQFEVQFARDNFEITYLELDRDLFRRRSGFHGDMFPPEKLQSAIRKIADDIRTNYGPTLEGDDTTWAKMSHLKAHPARPAHLP